MPAVARPCPDRICRNFNQGSEIHTAGLAAHTSHRQPPQLLGQVSLPSAGAAAIFTVPSDAPVTTRSCLASLAPHLLELWAFTLSMTLLAAATFSWSMLSSMAALLVAWLIFLPSSPVSPLASAKRWYST